MKIKLLFLTLILFLFNQSFSQGSGCPLVTTGPNQTLNCNQTCTDISATVFDVGETTTYSVNSIPYAPPISFNYPGGTGVSVNTDDVWSSEITLPFPFCFFGQTYNSCQIGSNGAVRMGYTSGNYHPWPFNASCPSPNLVEAGNIFGPYHDIDPSVSGSVKYYLLGTSPCQTLIIVYNNIAQYDCTNLNSTFMIVLYETTNIIETYIQNKPVCSGWNAGRALIGIQNNTGTQGYTPPGRNTGSWAVSSPEAWSFKPSGTPIYSNVEWFEGSTSLGVGSTINVCPSNDVNTYTARTTYTRCDGIQIIEEDDIVVNFQESPEVHIAPSNTFSCAGQNINLIANTIVPVSYLWNFGQTTPSISVNPNTTTEYNVVVTDLTTGCTGADTSTISIAQPTNNQCNVFYVSTTGTPNGDGTRLNPLDLKTALNLGACNGTIIKMAQGDYLIDSTITNITNYITLEGGYNETLNWQKESTAGATRILRSNTNVTDEAGNYPRLIAISMSGVTGFRFQDITIEVVDAPSTIGLNKGISTYALYMNNCSDYEIVRTQIISGNASNGAGDDNPLTYNAFWDGQNGIDGGNGTRGQAGESSCSFFTDSGGSGGAGGNGSNGGVNATGVTGANGTAGTNGGVGGRGQDDDNSGGTDGANGVGIGAGIGGLLGANDGGNDDDPYGGQGGNGVSGINGVNGTTTASSYLFGFYNPSFASNGTAGTGGAGAGGGGGGGRDTGGCNGAGGGGSGGGGGAGGGGAGKGATGGGSSYAVFIFSGATGGNFVDCNIQSGNFGIGGIGGSGGIGGAGGTSMLGFGHPDDDSNLGGAGGTGGAGGNGGSGGSATNGESFGFYINGNIPQMTSGGTNIVLISNGNNPISFDLANQAMITMEDISCTFTDVNFSNAASVNWNLGNGSTPSTATGIGVLTQYTNLGRKDISSGVNVYSGFGNMILDAQIAPNFTTTANLVNGRYVACVGETIGFSATNGNASYVYNWDLGANANPQSTFNGLNIANVSASYSQAGVYSVELFYSTNCCGQSVTATIDLYVYEMPIISMPADENICLGNTVGVGLIVGGITNEGTISWSPSVGLNATDTSSVIALPLNTTTYIVSLTDSSGLCSVQDSVKVNVTDLQLVMSATPSSCAVQGSATVNVTGGSGNYSYLWSNGMTTQNISNLQVGTYSVVVFDNSLGCADSSQVNVNATAGVLVATTTKNDVTCFGLNNGSLTVNISGGTAPFTYTWNPSGAVTGPTNNLSDTKTNLSEGIYSISIEDNTGCTFVIEDTINAPLAIIFAQDSIFNPECAGLDSGYIRIRPDGGERPYSFYWTNGMPLNQVNDDVYAEFLSAGAYVLVLTDDNGCIDSVEVNLTTITFLDAIADTVCAGTVYQRINGSSFTTSVNVILEDTIQTVIGCDSVVTTNLQVNAMSSDTLLVSICDGENYLMPDASTENTAGVYSFAYSNVLTCDSFYVVRLSLLNNFNVLVNKAICDDDNYILPNGEVVSQSGSYYDTLMTVYGCDSVVKTNLIVNETYITNVEAVISSENTSFMLPDGTVINSVGNYQSDLISIYGCDSIVNTNVREVEEWGIPNIFSPNASQEVNKVFTIINQHDFVKLTMLQIYNRWGQKIFDNQESGLDYWDGYYNGSLQSPGNYTYMIQVKDKQDKLSDVVSGNFLLVW